jgi:hypothetical protein
LNLQSKPACWRSRFDAVKAPGVHSTTTTQRVIFGLMMWTPAGGDAMARGHRRKCKHCQKLFRPDARNRDRQCYCSASACRAASKAASQARWLSAPENQDYFRGPVNVARVRAWRGRHPQYWRKGRRVGPALQDPLMAQAIESPAQNGHPASSPLQEMLSAQPALLMGLIAHLAGTPLQDDIVRTTGRLLRLGQDILAHPPPARAPPPCA